jgi:hypothetical protein
MAMNEQEQHQKHTVEETDRLVREILAKVEALQSLLCDMSRDELLELWIKRDDAGCYGNPTHQLAIIRALKQFHHTECPLYPYDITDDKQRFTLLPSYLLSEVERSIREVVERDALYAFGILERCGFVLDDITRVTLIENRVHQIMKEDGYKYWKNRAEASNL